MKEYQVINILEGIYEEYVRDNDKDYMERNTALTEAVKALTEIQYYRAIGTVEECREARERQIPKKPNKMEYKPLFDFGWRYACPSCGCAVGANEYDGEFTQQDDYCATCGQKLDWSE